MVVANFNHGHLSTRQYWFRSLLKLKMSYTHEWNFMKGCPYEVLDHAITHAIQARDEVICRNNELNSNKHHLHFQRKKNNQQTITIRSKSCCKSGSLKFYVRYLHNKQITKSITRHKDNNPLLHYEHRRKNHNWPNLEGKVEMDSKLMFNRKLGYWTFVWVYGKNVENCNDIQVAENLNVVAIDPGVRTGWSWYSPSKGCGWFGNLDINRVFRLSLSLDDLISRTTHAPSKKRNSMKRAQARLRCRIRNLVEECHKKVALWFLTNFDVIIIPPFNGSA
ncbi:13805_t:CDS:2, partial [Gigaspora margarita]